MEKSSETTALWTVLIKIGPISRKSIYHGELLEATDDGVRFRATGPEATIEGSVSFVPAAGGTDAELRLVDERDRPSTSRGGRVSRKTRPGGYREVRREPRGEGRWPSAEFGRTRLGGVYWPYGSLGARCATRSVRSVPPFPRPLSEGRWDGVSPTSVSSSGPGSSS